VDLYFNGIIDSEATRATAMAVQDGKITAIGSDAEILSMEKPGCKKFNLEGKTVWPGLIDSHLHFDMYSQSLTQVKCETITVEECLELVRMKSKSTPPGEWITGQGWNQNIWGKFGTSSQLDTVSGDCLVFLSDKSIHAAWVNSAALVIAGIDKNTPDPDGGEIQRDSKGNPTGILFENAVNLVEKLIPPISMSKRLEYMRDAQKSLHSLGLTGIHDFDRMECLYALQELHKSGELTLRVTKGIPVETLDQAIAIGLQSGFGDPHLHLGSVKLFADGALGPQSAAMLLPYEDTTDKFGTLLLRADDVFELGMKATLHGWSLAIHAIGDKATNEVLNGLAMVRQYEISQQIPQKNHRIEHLQLLHPDNFSKARDTGVIASMQPIHILSDMDTADKHWGKRARGAYAFASLLNNGTKVIFGSDAPVESPNPFIGIGAAVTRRRANDETRKDGWYPAEKISVNQAKIAYTEMPASISGYQNHFGRLKANLAADFIILQGNPETIDKSEINTLLPEKVVVDGNCVFER
jgi:predicted amidohydrolase YtcJ